jgi:hypothetical protein
MKIKLDENLPLRLVILLKDLGHDVHTPHDELLIGHPAERFGKRPRKNLDF